MECLLKKALLVLALASCPAVAVSAKQTSSVRVGSVSEESAADDDFSAAQKEEGRADDRNRPKAPAANREKDTKTGAADKNKRTGAAAPNPPAVSSNNSNQPLGANFASQGTSDGASRKNDTPTVPTGPSRGALAAEKSAATSSVAGPVPPANPNAVAPPPAPAPTSIYKVGVGDVLDIRLLNTSQRESTLFTVMPGGLIDYPLAGDPFNVSGMTTDEVAVRVAAELRRRAVHERPQVIVSVRDYTSHTVLVSGLVGDPGIKILRREAIPLYVLIAEAQPKPEAGRAVIMSYATGQTRAIDLTDAQGMASLVYPSDVVNLLARPQEFYYVGGEVGSPGQKDFHAGLTLTQALLASGGTTRAAGVTVRVSRQGADGRLASTVYDLNHVRDGKIPDPTLQPGDRIEVERVEKKK